jgi:hypothetical protein
MKDHWAHTLADDYAKKKAATPELYVPIYNAYFDGIMRADAELGILRAIVARKEKSLKISPATPKSEAIDLSAFI